ncbi:phosphatidylglycerophosphate phosphatase 1, chloroplastic/mitochondrial-like isoform X2 [Actinidia eriantha]|uniref:phosphatidylglycerophosphate phosphatase 1, chloroplastic/mitochondrial-like isoform X2 n=1 Tax=Actinidia eriantha TaxID=165200 RepID=UPI002585CDBD|nr:phosphatidylglycerophosphate phosphatase 1, chloroplastic/mitochondrial-like isoform X2 [Actinidia eriantha]
MASLQLCYCPIPKHYLHFQHLHLSSKRTTIPICLNTQTHFTTNNFPTLTATNTCSCGQERKKKKKGNSYPNRNPYPNHKWEFTEELCSSSEYNRAVNRSQKRESEEGEVVRERGVKESEGISSDMGWADVKAALGQRINLEGIVSSAAVLVKDRHLALPHVAVPDIRYMDWTELKRKGFRGVVFDKDNTITVPYSLALWGPLGSSIERCKSVFGNDIAVFSNSAGLYEFDPDGRKARALEGATGIRVIRHRIKKPAGTAEEIEKHFGCESLRLIMVGDRPFTDVVYGNRNGFLTVLTEPLSLSEEPFIVKQVRKLEIALVNRWSKRGLKPTSHLLLPDPFHCVNDPPPFQVQKMESSPLPMIAKHNGRMIHSGVK